MRKKLQQQNNEAAQKRFTTFIALLVVLLFVIGGSLQVQAQVTNTNGTHIAGIESLTGCSEDQVRAAVSSGNTFPDNPKQIFFLYNVKTGLLLNAGGYWGTHVSLKEYGMPLWIHIDEDKDKDDKKGWIHLAQEFDTKESKEEGNYLEYETGKSLEEDNGVYIDRAYIYKGLISEKIVKRGWKLEAVADKPNTYKYKLYTYRNTPWSTNKYPSFDETKKYYLIATKTQGDVDRNCYVVEEGNKEITEHNDEWRFLSYQQILDLQHENTNNIISSIDLTFRLQCPGFSRENAAMHNWKAYQYGGSGQIRLGLEHYYKPFVKNSNGTTAGSNIKISDSYTNDFENKTIKNYKFPDGSNAITFTENENYERHCGKYYCADAKNFRGTIYQDVKVSHSGAYVIECKGFSTTTKAKLYACLVKDNNTADPKTMHATILGQTDYMSAQEKAALHIEEQNMDYAAKEFYGSHKYFNSVLVQVPEGGGTIRFGIEIGTQDDTVPVESKKEWTVFDDFRLLYTSKTTDGDLVLDQDRDNLDYLEKCSNTYKSVTLHLNKTFDKDKWNGFVLPVSLTKDQLTQAFGPNVKLAKLNKLTSNEIQFVSIDMSKVGNDEIAMQAYIPYIIFPTKHAEQEQTPAYTASLSSTGNDQATKVSVSIGKNHIDIPNVTFAVVDGKNENDLSNMNTTNWTTNSRIVVDGSGTPFVTGDGKMIAFGTFARTFGTGTQNTTEGDDNYGKWTIENKSNIIAGRSDLKGCYFFSNGKMYSSATRARGLRGFSVWFAPTTASGNPAKPANVFLDGVSLDKTTGINPIIYGEEESRIDRFAHGIYSLNGQLISNSSSLDGLPSGIYILNGKKVIKR